MKFKVSGSQFIPDFAQVGIGLEPGESNSIDITANEAYGPYQDELIRRIPKSSLPADLDTEIGQRLEIIQK